MACGNVFCRAMFYHYNNFHIIIKYFICASYTSYGGIQLKKVLITGSEGQLGQEFIHFFKTSNKYDVYSFGRTKLDITNEKQVMEIIEAIRPHIIIHCAAYTNVDEAETDKDNTFLINTIGTKNIVLSSEKIRSSIVYFSTDYVFDGNKTTPYDEFDLAAPLNIYGRSKLTGEEIVKEFHSKYFIVRTSWLFGTFGNNFVKTMLRLAETKNELRVVTDQIGSPTFTYDLARQVGAIIQTNKYGTYHITNEGSCSWYEFAKEIFHQMNVDIYIKKCLSEDFPRPAQRPVYSVLDNMMLRLNGFDEMPHWKNALARCLQQMKSFS